MSNPYYDHTTFPAIGASGSSQDMRSELDLVEAGFDKLPTLSGNGDKMVFVNTAGTALEARTGFTRLYGAWTSSSTSSTLIMTSTANSSTYAAVAPNGTATASGMDCWNKSDPANASAVSMLCSSTDAILESYRLGTGTILPLSIKINGTVVAKFHTAGRTTFGASTDDGVNTLQVAGAIRFVPAASSTPVNNGDLTFEATSNTSLKIKYKGSDGTVRSTTLTLS